LATSVFRNSIVVEVIATGKDPARGRGSHGFADDQDLTLAALHLVTLKSGAPEVLGLAFARRAAPNVTLWSL